ncbi:peptidoglycan-binding protein [Acidocella sp.]|jgi:chemotaxis protein MotB|uniref:peptidoglycan-binding protein n=1 Tax=Acidocella sp. TaxID=50710 RepID=UPI002F41F5AF
MRGRRNGNGLEAWPGYVDALSTLLMVTIFVLLVFVLAEAFLSSALTGSDNTITRLQQQIAALSQSLSLETSKDTTLAQEMAALNAQLAAAQTANTGLTQQLATANSTITALNAKETGLESQLSDAQAQASSATNRITALQEQMATLAQQESQAGPSLQQQLTTTQGKLAESQKLTQQQQDQIALLNQQIAAMRLQLAVLNQALDAARTLDAKENVQIADLGQQLNEALARKVEELQQYQSAFFHAMRDALANEPNIKIVGDRFVFESDVLFSVDRATITPAGQKEIAQVASAIQEISKKIPPNVNWVLSVDGYADSQAITGGPYHSNFDLSSARALAVLDLLVKDGVPQERLAATAMGSNNPLATGTTPADYAQNRRIEFRLTTP